MRWTAPGARAERDLGMSTLEVVLLAPLVVIVLLVLAGLGLMVNAKGVLNSAASDAARMGSLQRSEKQANTQAAIIAEDDLGSSVACADGLGKAPLVTTSPDFVAGGVYMVTLQCKVDYFGVSMNLSSTAVSPIDTYRQVN